MATGFAVKPLQTTPLAAHPAQGKGLTCHQCSYCHGYVSLCRVTCRCTVNQDSPGVQRPSVGVPDSPCLDQNVDFLGLEMVIGVDWGIKNILVLIICH